LRSMSSIKGMSRKNSVSGMDIPGHRYICSSVSSAFAWHREADSPSLT
jgi:hypothetical protein